MIVKTLTVQNRLGIHARPSGMIVQLTSQSNSDVQMKYQGMNANAKSILNIMMLAIEPGAAVEFTITGPDEHETFEKLETLFDARFDEDE